jgi:hypothetical protein
MKSSLDREAASLRVLCLLGTARLPEAIAWADEWVLRLDHPPYDLIEISISRDVKTAIHHLEQLSLSIGDFEAIRLALPRLIHHCLTEVESRELARFLYGLAVKHRYQVPDEFKFTLWYDEEFDLAEQGTYGILQDVNRRFLAELQRIADGPNI